MSYPEYINNLLKPKITQKEIVLDLFAGCGGLSLGFEAAGYETIGYEMDASAAATYNHNLAGKCHAIKLDTSFEYPKAEIIVGGPPVNLLALVEIKRIEDARDGFPIFIEAVKKLQPKVFMFENVRGLLYSNKWYFELVIKELRKLGYFVSYRLLNAVSYGVPQNRERLFVIGHRTKFEFPKPGIRKTTVGDAIGDIMYDFSSDSKFLTPSMDEYVAKYEKASACINPRDLYFDRPARTLTCRNLAGATGDMQRVRLKDGRRRRITVHEAARLQTFPDTFDFVGNETSKFNQIGNAVPLLAWHLARALKACYNSKEEYSINEINQNTIQHEVLTLF